MTHSGDQAPRAEPDQTRLDDHASDWEAVASCDPLWGVYSIPEGRDGAWDLNAFFERGRTDAAQLRKIVKRAGGTFAGRTLDFGCGVGRLSQALSAYVDHVLGVDIAAPMIDRANALNTRPDAVEFVLNRSYELPFDDASFDLAVSLYVFQHMEPAMSLRFLKELARVLRPGGTLAVQITSGPLPVTPIPPEGRRASLEIVSAPASLVAGEVGFVRVRVTNDSTLAWPFGELIKLANHWRRDGEIVIADDGREDLPADVAPARTIELDLRISAPDAPGRYEIEIDIVQEFVAWWAETGNAPARHAIDVVPATDDAIESTPTARAGDSIVKMYGLPKEDVLSALEDAGCDVLGVEPDDFEHEGWLSYTYVARARGFPEERGRRADASTVLGRVRRLFSGGTRTARQARPPGGAG